MKFTISQSCILFVLKVGAFCLISVGSASIYSLFGIRVLVCLGHVYANEGVYFRQTGIVVTMMNRCVINYGGDQCVSTNFFKRRVMCVPVVHFAIYTTCNLIGYSQTTIMDYGGGIPITVCNM